MQGGQSRKPGGAGGGAERVRPPRCGRPQMLW